MNRDDYERLREITGPHAIAPVPSEDTNVAYIEIDLDRAGLLETDLLNDLNETGYMHRADRKVRPSGMQLQFMGRFAVEGRRYILFEDVNAQ